MRLDDFKKHLPLLAASRGNDVRSVCACTPCTPPDPHPFGRTKELIAEMAGAPPSHLKILIFLFTWAIAASARQQATELNPIAKNRDSLPTNGISSRRLLVASKHQMLYNNSAYKLIYNNVSSFISNSRAPPILAEILRSNCLTALNNFGKNPLAP
jgi:hypothetical protein